MNTTATAAPPATCILAGEDTDPTRRGDKTIVAVTEVHFHCPDAATAGRLADELRAANANLRGKPHLTANFDYQSCYLHPDPTSPDRGGTIVMRVAWYHLGYYHRHRDDAADARHRKLLTRIGLAPADLQVWHWRADTEPGHRSAVDPAPAPR